MIQTIKVNPYILTNFFDYKTSEMCKSCKRYNTKSTCPPNVSSIEYYEKIIPTYKHAIVCYDIFDVTDKSKWVEIGKSSSLSIHNYLLKRRDELFSEGHYYVNIFGAGSCKLCEKCTIPCSQPNKSIIPLEATGMNVVRLMKYCKVDISFPIKDSLYRIGIILYD